MNDPQPIFGNRTEIDPGNRQVSPRLRVGFLVGPTGVGKSALAVELAERLGAEIVNADSRQVYRGMDIGTAKPSSADRARVAHHLLDIRTPDNPIDVAEFANLARAAINEIAARGKRVLVVGGSGLYLRVLRGGIFEGPPASVEIRRELRAIADRDGIPQLHRRLAEVDPDAAARISPNDLRRIERALEVFQLTGIPISAHQRTHRFAERPYDSLTVGLTMDRGRLYEAIDRRFDAMVAAGLIEEVRAMIEAGYRIEAPLRTIGYREIAAYLRDEISLDDAIERAKRESRHLAKRQFTWFRREEDIVWLDASGAIEKALTLYEDFFRTGLTARTGMKGPNG